MKSEHEPKLTVPVTDRDHTQGPADAPVTLVEYGDYQCPYCGQAYLIVKELQRRLGEQLRFVFRNFPLTTMHPHAELAAEAAEAAGVQGRFWEMHDTLYENQDHLDRADVLGLAQRLDLDFPRFASDIQHGVYAARVHEDFLSGVRSGVNGTPSFFINGVRYDDAWDGPAFLEALVRESA
jgi:protein-disulfide isomerase